MEASVVDPDESVVHSEVETEQAEKSTGHHSLKEDMGSIRQSRPG